MNTATKLEHPFGRILQNARQGCGLSEAELAHKVGLTPQQIVEIEKVQFLPDDSTVRTLAALVRLHPARCVAIAHDQYLPAPVDLGRWGCIAQITLPYTGVPTHAYVMWDQRTKEAVLFDTGAKADPIHDLIRERGLTLQTICLTHTHEDHVEALPELRARYHPTVIASQAEPVDGGTFVREGDVIRCGSLTIRVFETDSHSPGGLTFVVSGFGRGLPDVAVVGDVIFAGSMGRPKISFERMISNVKTKISALPDDTPLLSGHGPLTTLREEKQNNPFFF